MLRLDVNLIFTVINILIWFAIVRIFLFKPINKIIDKRQEAIKAQYEDAERIKDEAGIEKMKCIAFQNEIEEEKKKAVAEATKNAYEEYNSIVADATKEAERIVNDSKREATLEKEKILNQTSQEIKAMIMNMAVQSMEKGSDDGTLYDQFLAKAGESDNAEK